MHTKQSTSFSLATYNILAQAYIRPRRYPNSPRSALERASRRRLVLERLEQLDADILCLQEVEPDAFADISQLFGDRYYGIFEQKRGKPDGAAIFVRSWIVFRESHTLHYAAHDSGDDQLALIAQVCVGARELSIVSTHLRWQAPETPKASHLGRRQLVELLEHKRATAGEDATWIIAGDFNANSESVVLQAAFDDGFQLSCRSQRPWDTTNINGRRRKIDYMIFPRDHLVSKPGKLPRLARDAPMPSMNEPSDHLPLRVDFSWSRDRPAT